MLSPRLGHEDTHSNDYTDAGLPAQYFPPRPGLSRTLVEVNQNF